MVNKWPQIQVPVKGTVLGFGRTRGGRPIETEEEAKVRLVLEAEQAANGGTARLHLEISDHSGLDEQVAALIFDWIHAGQVTHRRVFTDIEEEQKNQYRSIAQKVIALCA
jgi:hypothetical protein